ncbi:MAG: hypothetical protein HFI31_16305 [Lachnospiraceae bacterium]|nr:hypothetical protein [Lachnospiraceae bacterium]MCI8997112.1 hypothetical protein [Lachnospiraceae bacterium]MCI9135724.1 hypothetical protein [Lachnospiraceae bacterium]
MKIIQTDELHSLFAFSACILAYGIKEIWERCQQRVCFFGVAMVGIFTFLAVSFWSYGVHKYESASSKSILERGGIK